MTDETLSRNPSADLSARGSAEAAAPARRGLDPILWLVGGIFVAYLAVNLTMIWVAGSASSELVTRDYYERAKTYDRVMAARAASRATGWQVDLAAPGKDSITFTVRDAAGEPVTGLTGTVEAYRPSDSSLDQPLTVSEAPQTPGHYRAAFARPASGLWAVTLDLSRGDSRLRERLRVVAP